MNNNIESELAKIQNLLVSGDLSIRQYEQLYSAQQALAWALDSRSAKNPVATVLQGKIFAPVGQTGHSILPAPSRDESYGATGTGTGQALEN